LAHAERAIEAREGGNWCGPCRLEVREGVVCMESCVQETFTAWRQGLALAVYW
jgi:hypothetical protein